MTIAEPIRFLPQDFGIGHKLSYWAVGAVPMKSLNWGAKIGILGGLPIGGLYILKSKQGICLQREEMRVEVSQEKETKKKMKERERLR